MTTALLPGSFDPFTVGHLDLVRRATAFADRVVIAVGTNRAKTPFLSATDRRDLIRRATADIPGIDVVIMEGTTIALAQQVGATIIVKGVRDGADVAWENAQAAVNREMGGIDTIYLPTRPELAHISSSVVRELYFWGMDISRYVPPAIAEQLRNNGGNAAAGNSPQNGGAHV